MNYKNIVIDNSNSFDNRNKVDNSKINVNKNKNHKIGDDKFAKKKNL